MSQTKVVITIDESVLAKVDALVERQVFSNRSRAIQEAVQEKLGSETGFSGLNFVLLLLAFPVITVALFLLSFQRNFGATFFDVNQGADPLLWQHLFWFFGHPEVYIIILPSFGIISEVLPTFARKPLFGYKFVVFSGAAIGFVGWGVWAHHMFASGLGPVSVAVFSVATMLIAIPTGVKIVNWTLTLWGGKLQYTTAMLFAIGVIVLFTIGGLSGVTHAVAPSDTQQTDTYHIVAHFHYVIVGGAVMGLFAGFYYWWPKMFGQMLSERLGKWNFWLMFFGVNLTFAPMHILGLQGQPRRMVVWPDKLTGDGFFDMAFWNKIASLGAFVIAAGVLLFVINIGITAKRKEKAKETDPARQALLEAEQLAYKLTANSLYGQLGSGTFKVRLQHLAASVTAYGRKQIMFAKDVIDEFYGPCQSSQVRLQRHVR